MQNKRVLVVEDEGVTAMGLQTDLQELGLNVVGVVASGEEAVRMACELRPDLILMDITLAGPMDGVQAAREIGKVAPTIPVVYLTAHADTRTVERAKITEPAGYLPKPCSKNTMASTLAVALYRAEAEAGRRQAEESLRRVQAEQKMILDNIGVGVLFLRERKVVWANPALIRMFGYPQIDTKVQDTEIFYQDHQTYREVGEKAYAALARGEVYSCHIPMRKWDGTDIWCAVVGQAVDPAHLEQGAIWIVEDLTERRGLEESLLRREEMYRTVADFTHDWEFWIAPDESIVYCSPSCQRVTGYPAKAFVANPSLQRQIVHPDDLAAYDAHRHSAKEGDGCEALVYRIVRPDGGLRWLSHVCQPVFDALGQFTGNRGSNRDITEQKALEAEVAKARNLESLGMLVGGLAHDFNNLHQGLLGNISLAQMYVPPTSEAHKFLENAEKCYQQANKLTSELVAFSSGGVALRATMQPSNLIRETILAETRGANVEVDFALAADLGEIKVDPVQFVLCLKHLATNALDAMPTGGTMQVRADNVTVSVEQARTIALTAGDYLRLSIEDHGCGILGEHLPRIFDPYFSTKERCAKKGMGLGLALCNTIVAKHGGAITVETAVGRGSPFHVHLPLASPPPPADGGRPVGAGKGARLLIMDDDHGVGEVATQFLSRSGYRGEATGDGQATVAAYRQAMADGDPFALVILDLIIPGGMGGKEVLAQLKEIDPGVKAIISSGYVDDPTMTNFRDYGFVGAFQKPYRLAEMRQALEGLL